MGVKRRDVEFDSEGTSCAGWLYLPTLPDEPPPVVVMAHGLGGERSWRLPAYAERFGRRGIASFVFDYRSFGDSDGDPRHVIDPSMQLADWSAAVTHVRSRADVDADRLGLWGSSFSGGHVIATAARDGEIDAAVAQVPFSDGLRNTLHVMRQGGLRYVRASLPAGLRDALRAVRGADPIYVPVAAEPEEFGVLNTPGALAGYESLAGEEWANETAARLLFSVPRYRPISSAGDVECPVLIVQAADDRIVPASTVDSLVEALDHVERIRLPIDHFGAYHGDGFERAVAAEADFLDRHLR